LFLRLRQGANSAAVETLSRLEQDHQAIESWNRDLNLVCRRWLANICLEASDIARVRILIRQLQQVYESRIALEDRELLRRVREMLTAKQLREIAAEMANRQGIAQPQSVGRTSWLVRTEQGKDAEAN